MEINRDSTITSPLQLIEYTINTKWSLPINIHKQLESYYILRWDTDYLVSQLLLDTTSSIADNTQLIHRKGVTYKVVMLANTIGCEEVWLSFREPKRDSEGSYPIVPTVLIKPVYECNGGNCE